MLLVSLTRTKKKGLETKSGLIKEVNYKQALQKIFYSVFFSFDIIVSCLIIVLYYSGGFQEVDLYVHWSIDHNVSLFRFVL